MEEDQYGKVENQDWRLRIKMRRMRSKIGRIRIKIRRMRIKMRRTRINIVWMKSSLKGQGSRLGV